MPIPIMMAAPLLSQGVKYLIYAAIVIALLGALYWMANNIYKAGGAASDAKWLQREAKINKESSQLLAQKTHEYEEALKLQQSQLVGAFHESEKLRGDIERDFAESKQHRLHVTTRKPPCDSNPMPSTATSSGGVGGTGSEFYAAELERQNEQDIRRDYREVAEGAAACKVLLEKFVVPNFEVIK